MQTLALKGKNSSDRIFVNEMMQLYDLLARVAKDSELEFAKELLASLPKSHREYTENINFMTFETEAE